MSRMERSVIGAAALLVCCGVAAAGEPNAPLIAEFPPDAERCYGRAYTRGHLAKHPRQKVTEIYLYRSLTDDHEAETPPRTRAEVAAENIAWERATRDEDSVVDGSERGRSSLDILVAFNDRPEMFQQSLECRRFADGGFTCGVECDGGNFRAKSDDGGLMMRFEPNGGLRVQSGCSSGDESAPEVRIEAADDAAALRLEALPMERCHRARDASRPDWVTPGVPTLRQRFAATGGLCFATPAALPAEADKRLASLTLKTLGAVQVNREDGGATVTLDVEVEAVLKTGKRVSRAAHCLGDDYAFDCTADGEGFKLTRSGANGLSLLEPYYEGEALARFLGLKNPKKFAPIGVVAAKPEQCR